MRKFLIPVITFVVLFSGIGIAFGAPTTIFQRNILPETDNTYDLGSTTPLKTFKNIFTQNASTSALIVSGQSASSGNNCLQIDGTGIVTKTGSGCGGVGSTPGGSNSQVQYNGSGAFAGVSTTTASCSGSASCTSFTIIGSSPITITSTGGGSSDPFTHGTQFGQSTSASSTLLHLTGSTFSLSASSTSAFDNSTSTFSTISSSLWLPFLSSSQLPYIKSDFSVGGVATGSQTISSPLTGGPFTVVGTGGAIGCTTAASGVAGCLSNTAFDTFNNKLSSYDPFTHGTQFGQSFSATSTLLHLSGSVFSLSASNTAAFDNASTTLFTNTGSTWLTSLLSGALSVDGSGLVYKTATSTPTATAPITYSGTLGQFIGGVSGTFGCTTASAGVTGCLSGTDWSTFNNKLGSYDPFSHPIAGYSATTSAVSIGTSTPVQLSQLTVGSSTAPQIALADNGNNNGFSIRTVSNTVYFATTSPTTFATSSAPSITITSSNHVGIATTTASTSLSVHGTASVNVPVNNANAFTVTGADAVPRLNIDTTPTATSTLLVGTTTIATSVASGESLVGTLTAGANATSTINFGEIGVATSKVCFNIKNSVGGDISFYFVGTTLTTENNVCR